MRKAFAAFLAVPALLLAVPASAADDMSAAERKAIESVVEDYLVRNPEIVERALRALEAKRKEEEQRAVEAALKTYRDDLHGDSAVPVGGNPEGDVTLIEFFDYRCGVCKRVHPIVAQLMKSDPKIRRVYKDWPILGPDSVFAARAALASRAQGKYLEYHDALMAYRGKLDMNAVVKIAERLGMDKAKLLKDMDSGEIRKIISRNFAVAEALKLNGTPSFVIGDQVIRGGRDLATMKKLIADARAAEKD